MPVTNTSYISNTITSFTIRRQFTVDTFSSIRSNHGLHHQRTSASTHLLQLLVGLFHLILTISSLCSIVVCDGQPLPSCPYQPLGLVSSPQWSLQLTGPVIAPTASHASFTSPSPFTNIASTTILNIPTTGQLDLLLGADNQAYGSVFPDPPTNVFGYSLWLYFDIFPSSANVEIFSRTDGGTNRWSIYSTTNIGELLWTTTNSVSSCNLGTWVLGRWYHLVMTGSSAGGSGAVWVDGNSVGGCTAQIYNSFTATTAKLLPLGGAALRVGRFDFYNLLFTASSANSLFAAVPAGVNFLPQFTTANASSLPAFYHPFTQRITGAPWFAATNGLPNQGVASPTHYAHEIKLYQPSGDLGGVTTIMPTIIDPPLTISAWIYLNEYPGYPDVLLVENLYTFISNSTTNATTSISSDVLDFYINYNGQLVLMTQYDTQPRYYTAAQEIVPLFKWTHVTITLTNASPMVASFFINSRWLIDQQLPLNSYRLGVVKNHTSISGVQSATPRNELTGSGIQYAQLLLHSRVLTQFD